MPNLISSKTVPDLLLLKAASNLTVQPSVAIKPHAFSTQSKMTLVAFSVMAIIGALFIILGSLNIFGALPQISFLASVITGSGIMLLSAGGILWSALKECRSSDPSNKSKHIIPGKTADDVQEIKQEPKVPIKKEELSEPLKTFQEQALARLAGKAAKTFTMPDLEDKETADKINVMVKHFRTHSKEDTSFKLFHGAVNECWTNDTLLPGVIFKKQKQKAAHGNMKIKKGASYEIYKEISNEARQICKKEEDPLYLLQIPQCELVGKSQSIVMQEKVELLFDNWDAQKNLFRWAMGEESLEGYIKELFRQLAVFICKMGFSDVKYNNIQFTKDGRIVLYDIDKNEPIAGLLNGGVYGGDTQRRFGLLSMLPSKWINEKDEDSFLNKVIKPLLTNEDWEFLLSELPVIKKKVEKTEMHMEEAQKFYKNRITSPTQHIPFDEQKFASYDPNISNAAKIFFEHANQKLDLCKNLSLVTGRKVRFDLRFPEKSPLFQAINEQSKTTETSADLNYEQFKAIATSALEALKVQGFIISYYVGTSGIKIVC